MGAYVIAAVDDILFASKIRGTAEQVGVRVVFPRTIDAVMEAACGDTPSLIIADLHSQKIDAIELAKRLKSDEHFTSIPLLGFFSHVQKELRELAEEAGFERVIPRSAFSSNLAEILSGR
jgi:CheY-like chemotaxis protein